MSPFQAYNEHLDVIGHEYGPDSNDMKIAINEVDRYLAQFFEAMKKRDMYGKVNKTRAFTSKLTKYVYFSKNFKTIIQVFELLLLAFIQNFMLCFTHSTLSSFWS